MNNTAQQHKVYLQKRSLSGEMKQLPALKSANTLSVSCSLCPESFPGAKELGLHILTAHCDAKKQEAVTNEDNIVVEENPSMLLKVEVDPSTTKEGVVVKSTPTTISPRQQGEPPALNLPRQPTASEVKEKFMIYRLSDTSNRYICLVCDKMYTSRYNIRMHMNLHSGNNVHKCSYCGRHFAHKHVYESHVRTHTGERPFSCGKCDRKFGDRSNCTSHRKRCNGLSNVPTPPDSPEQTTSPGPVHNLRSGRSINIAPNVSITPISKNKNSEETEMFDHADIEIDNGNDNEVTTFDPQIVSVESVNNNVDEEEDLVNMGYTGEEDEFDEDSEEMMIEPDISLEYDDIEETDEPISTVQKPVSNTIFTCSFCNVKYSQQPMLIEHLTTHIDIPSDPVQADIEQGYMVIYYSSRPKFMCLSCGKLFATAESVNLHLNIHNEDNIYACEHCDKIFAHKHIYESHRRAAHKDKEKGQEFDCSYCNNIFPNSVSLGNHMRVCKLKPREITPMTETYDLADKMILQIQAPVTKDKLVLLNNNMQKKNKPKANRPPPKLILLNAETSEIKKEELEHDHIIIQESEIKLERMDEEEEQQDEQEGQEEQDEEEEDNSDLAYSPFESSTHPTLAAKPTMTLLSDEAKMIFNSSAPQRRSSGSNPRAHRIVETENGREYIPDTNSNNILALDGIYPPPDSSEFKKGYMLRPVGPGGQQRYICVECGKHYTTSYNVRMHRNIHLGRNLYNCKFCHKEFSHKHVWEVS